MKSLKYAGFFRRFIAHTIDGFILGIISWGLFFSFGGSVNSFKISATIGSSNAIHFSLSAFISALYVIGFWVKRNGQTPGKSLMHIRVAMENDKPMDWFTGFIRYLGYYVSAFVFGLGYVWVLFDKNKQSWHDKIAKTYVIEADDKKPNKLLMAMGCLIPIITIVMITSLVAAGIFAGYNATKNKRPSTTSYKQSLVAMKPEAKTLYDQSQALFEQIKLSKDNPATVKKLNDENISLLKKALEIDPENALLWSSLSSAYTWVSSTGTIQNALEAAVKAAELDPGNDIYVTGLGDMLIRVGRYDDAILELNKVVRRDSNYAHPEFLLGQAYGHLKIYDQARTHYEKSIEIYTKYNGNGQYDDDILLAQKAMAQLPR